MYLTCRGMSSAGGTDEIGAAMLSVFLCDDVHRL